MGPRTSSGAATAAAANASTALKAAYVVGMLALAAAGALDLAFGLVSDHPLDGVEVSASRPALTLATVRDESYQQKLTAWFEQHWGLRGYAVRTDNTLVLAAFGETRGGTPAWPARDGVLMMAEDVDYVNRVGPPEAVIAAAKKTARLQTKLRARGIALVPVIIPAKTSIFRDAVPDRWRRRGAFGASDENAYGAFRRTLEAEGARFVDGRALLLGLHLPPSRIFAPTGRHWRPSAACRVLQEAVDVARADLPELGTAQIDCKTWIDPNPSRAAEELDLFRLLNVWRPKPSDADVEVFVGEHGTPGLQLPTLFVGSSFVWTFGRVSHDLEVLRPSLFYYYNAQVVDLATMAPGPKVMPHTAKWREETFSKRLVVMGILETYLPADGESFIQEVEEEVDRPSNGP